MPRDGRGDHDEPMPQTHVKNPGGKEHRQGGEPVIGKYRKYDDERNLANTTPGGREAKEGKAVTVSENEREQPIIERASEAISAAGRKTGLTADRKIDEKTRRETAGGEAGHGKKKSKKSSGGGPRGGEADRQKKGAEGETNSHRPGRANRASLTGPRESGGRELGKEAEAPGGPRRRAEQTAYGLDRGGMWDTERWRKGGKATLEHKNLAETTDNRAG